MTPETIGLVNGEVYDSQLHHSRTNAIQKLMKNFRPIFKYFSVQEVIVLALPAV